MVPTANTKSSCTITPNFSGVAATSRSAPNFSDVDEGFHAKRSAGEGLAGRIGARNECENRGTEQPDLPV